MHCVRFIAVLSALTLLAVPAARIARASPDLSRSAAADSCSAPLPPKLAFTSGPGIISTKLTGHGTLNLTTTRVGFFVPGFIPPANDHLAEFAFQPSGSKLHFAGPLSSFAHGQSMHFCVNQKLYIDFDESAHRTQHGMTNVHIDGTAAGKSVHVTVWVMGHTYRLSGTMGLMREWKSRYDPSNR